MQADEGFYYGLGAFETIAVEEGTPVFLEEHYERLERALWFLEIKVPMKAIREKAEEVLQMPFLQQGRRVLKITVSEQNMDVIYSSNHYTPEDYKRGFTTDFTTVCRNETSPLAGHKTLNYGDCILEKRKAKQRGIDEPIFRNTRGEIAEGAVSNVFFVQNGELVTPMLACGLLPGIMRAYLCKTWNVKEKKLQPQEIKTCSEMFLTNSLMGIMPVQSLGEVVFPSREVTSHLQEEYWDFIRRLIREP